MKVINVLNATLNDGGDTAPFPAATGFKLQLKAGDVLDPYGMSDGWFGTQVPAFILRFYLPVVIALALSAVWAWGIWAAYQHFGVAGLWFLLTFPLVPGHFMSLRIDRFGMYAGWKTYGVDSDAYKGRLCDPAEVYPGSLAMCFTIRFSGALS